MSHKDAADDGKADTSAAFCPAVLEKSPKQDVKVDSAESHKKYREAQHKVHQASQSVHKARQKLEVAEQKLTEFALQEEKARLICAKQFISDRARHMQ